MRTKSPNNNKKNNKNKNNNLVAEIVASTDDLLIEILLRLPLEVLLHFKIVSKQWHSLIGDPQFRRRFKVKHVPAVGMFLPTFTNYEPFEYVPFFPKDSTLTRKFGHPSDIRIKHACNGLLLCEKETNTPHKYDYYVYNPTTSQYSATLPRLDPKMSIEGMYLAFDPANSLYPYKVVCVHRLMRQFAPSNNHFLIDIYSPQTGEWRSSGLQPFPAMVDFRHGVYWNNAIHWISMGDGDALYYNVRNNVIQKMPKPPMPHPEVYWRRNYYFGQSCDHLHIIQIHGSEKEFNVYEMKRDYSEWFVKYHVDLSPLLSANPHIIRQCFMRTYWSSYAFCLLSIVRADQDEGGEDASFLVLQLQGKVIRYDIAARTSQKLLHSEGVEPAPVDLLRFRRINGFEFIESVCPI